MEHGSKLKINGMLLIACLANYEQPPLDASIAEELSEFVECIKSVSDVTTDFSYRFSVCTFGSESNRATIFFDNR